MAVEQDWGAYADQAYLALTDVLLVQTAGLAGVNVPASHVTARRVANGPMELRGAVVANAPVLGSKNGAAWFSNNDPNYGLVIGTNSADGHAWVQATRSDGTATAYDMTLQEAGGGVIIGAAARTVATCRNEYKVVTAAVWPLGLLGNDRGLFARCSAASGYFGYFEASGGTNVGSISFSGSTTSYNTTSDSRLKENISPASEDSGALIDALEVVSFDWKGSGEHVRFGGIAQQMAEHFPEAVHVPDDPEMMRSLDWSKFVPVILAEVQALRRRVAELEG